MKNQDQRTWRIGISGSYGGLNLGDEAILCSIIDQIRQHLSAKITVFSRNPMDTLSRHNVEWAVPVREMTRLETRQEIVKLDLLILGGGGILYDGEIDEYLREVTLAHELNIPVMVYAVSAGPLNKSSNRIGARDALNQAKVITVRDRQGRRLLEDIGVQQDVHLTADPALLLAEEHVSPEMLRADGLDLNRRLVGLSVREPGPAAPDIDVNHYHSLIANAADFIIHRLDADIALVPMERQNMDLQHSHAVVSKMQCPQRATVLKAEYSAGQILSLMKHFEFSVGMRLHFLIFSAMQGVPFIALPYATKVSGFIEALELTMPPLGRVNVGQLIAEIDRAWDYRFTIRDHLKQKLPAVQDLARQNHQHLIHLSAIAGKLAPLGAGWIGVCEPKLSAEVSKSFRCTLLFDILLNNVDRRTSARTSKITT